MKKLPKVIVFDFDGTIMETNKIKKVVIKNFILDEFGHLSKDQIENLIDKKNSRFEILAELVSLKPSSTIEDYNYIVEKLHIIMINKLRNAKFVEGVIEFIDKMYNLGIDLYISSNAPSNELIELCELFNIRKYFKTISGYPDQKDLFLKRIIQDYGGNKEICFIGDTISDYKVAQREIVDFVLRISEVSELVEFDKTLVRKIFSFKELLS